MKNFILVNLNDKNQVKVTSVNNNDNLLKLQNPNSNSNKLKQILPQQIMPSRSSSSFDDANDDDDEEEDDETWKDDSVSNSSFTSNKNEESIIDEDFNGENKPKKRCRLTHLTADEKLMRRKMKNRIAAQNARDRKKVRMDNLEVTVKELLDENKKLLLENKKLKEQTKQLVEENNKLKSSTNLKRKLNDVEENFGSQESAVFLNIVSQQKRQTLNLNQQNLIVLMIYWVMSLLKSTSTSQSEKVSVIKKRNQIVKIKLLKLVRLFRMKLQQKQRLKASLKTILSKQLNTNNRLSLLQQRLNPEKSMNMKKLILLIILSMKRV